MEGTASRVLRCALLLLIRVRRYAATILMRDISDEFFSLTVRAAMPCSSRCSARHDVIFVDDDGARYLLLHMFAFFRQDAMDTPVYLLPASRRVREREQAYMLYAALMRAANSIASRH